MGSVFDVAAYILSKQTAPITTWKLQKLVYYSQAWCTVWSDETLFDEPIEAWANGPVCPALYEQHRGQFKISKIEDGDSKKLSDDQKDTIDRVITVYGKFDSQYLSELSHREQPWIDARQGLKPGERGNKAITPDALAEYYGGLYKEA